MRHIPHTIRGFFTIIFEREKARGSLRAHGLFTSDGRADRISGCEDFNYKDVYGSIFRPMSQECGSCMKKINICKDFMGVKTDAFLFDNNLQLHLDNLQKQ